MLITHNSKDVKIILLLLFNVKSGVMATRVREFVPGRGWFRKINFNERGYVALFIACHRGHAKLVSRLMSLGIDPCRKMPSGRSAIHVAVLKKRITCVNLLIGKTKKHCEMLSTFDSLGFFSCKFNVFM